jgi:hypothetical protein
VVLRIEHEEGIAIARLLCLDDGCLGMELADEMTRGGPPWPDGSDYSWERWL